MTHAKLNKVLKAAAAAEKAGEVARAEALRSLVCDFMGEVLFPGVA